MSRTNEINLDEVHNLADKYENGAATRLEVLDLIRQSRQNLKYALHKLDLLELRINYDIKI